LGKYPEVKKYFGTLPQAKCREKMAPLKGKYHITVISDFLHKNISALATDSYPKIFLQIAANFAKIFMMSYHQRHPYVIT
jgi:hypothetical protein